MTFKTHRDSQRISPEAQLHSIRFPSLQYNQQDMDSFLLLFLSTERPHSPSSIPCHDHQPNTQESTSSVLCPSCQPSMLSPDWLLEAFQVQPSIQCLSSPLAFCRLHWASTLTLSLSTPRPRALSHVTV